MTPLRTVVAAAVITLAVPAMAQAKTKEMYAGSPPATTKKLGETVANAFFPSKLTVAAGDSVRFIPFGFHNVHLPEKGEGAAPFLVPSGQKVAGLNDAAGTPFWFNGQDAMGLNLAVLGAAGYGKKFTYTGAKDIQSGLPAEKSKPMTVKFTKAGSYTIYCDIHAGMKATVKVVKKGAKVPTAKQDAAAVNKQSDAAIAAAKDLASQSRPANTVSLGVAGKGGVEQLAMVPANLTVKPGTTVKFVMSKGSYEPHTATFGPGDITKADSYIGAIAKSFESPAVDARAVYPSDTSLVSMSPTLHGNGFWNSGALDAVSATPLPGDASVKFDTPGTYTYYCVIHPFMSGSVTVQ
jgi:plastocyanin